MKLRKSAPADGAQVMEVWRWAVDDTGRVIAFMLLEHNRMEALFVDPSYHRRGVGRILVEEALRCQPDLATDVNEQNAAALAFHERLGFARDGRSAVDGQGRCLSSDTPALLFGAK